MSFFRNVAARSLVVLGICVSLAMTAGLSLAGADTTADDPIAYALLSESDFLAAANASSQYLCENATKDMDRCVTVDVPRRVEIAGTASPASRAVARPEENRGVGVAAEPNCTTGFVRWNSCVQTDWGYQIWETRNGVPVALIGWMTLRFTTRVGWEYNSLNWTLRSTVKSVEAWGTEAGGPVGGQLSHGCNRDTQVCDSTSGSDFAVRLRPGVEYPAHWEQTETGVVSRGIDTIVSLDGYIGPWLVVYPRATGQPLSMNVALHNGVNGRCDRIVRTFPGCIAAENPAIIGYDSRAYPLVAEVAQHIYDAQAALADNPGWYGRGTPLHKGDASTEIANRAVACPAGQTPPGLSCDEYPIAQAREGAASGREYSVRYVSPGANSSQGGLTSLYIGYSRILLDEEFWVLAVLPDGRHSWEDR